MRLTLLSAAALGLSCVLAVPVPGIFTELNALAKVIKYRDEGDENSALESQQAFVDKYKSKGSLCCIVAGTSGKECVLAVPVKEPRILAEANALAKVMKDRKEGDDNSALESQQALDKYKDLTLKDRRYFEAQKVSTDRKKD